MRIVLYATLPLALAVLSTLRSRAVASTHNSRCPCLRRKFFWASRKPYDVMLMLRASGILVHGSAHRSLFPNGEEIMAQEHLN
jgi:hypothetical protein